MVLRKIMTIAGTGILAAVLYISPAPAQTEVPGQGIVDPESGRIAQALLDKLYEQGFDTAEDIEKLDTHITFDETEKAMKIITGSKSIINLKTVDLGGRFFDNKNLNYTVRAKSENFEGRAFLELWVEFAGMDSFFSRGFHSTVSGTSDWKVLQTPFQIRQGMKVSRAYLNIVLDGHGTLWLDDIKLTAVQTQK